MIYVANEYRIGIKISKSKGYYLIESNIYMPI